MTHPTLKFSVAKRLGQIVPCSNPQLSSLTSYVTLETAEPHFLSCKSENVCVFTLPSKVKENLQTIKHIFLVLVLSF